MTVSKSHASVRWAQIYNDLRRRILSCELPPGTGVSEATLARLYRSSPTPVRDALARLRQETLVTAGPGRGYQIAPLSVADIRELAEARSVLETGIVRLAIETATADELEALASIARPEPAVALNESQRIALNRRFHLAIAELTHNRRLVAMEARVLDDSERVFHIGIGALPQEQMEAGHYSLVDALRRGDVDGAVELSQRESFDTCQRVLQMLVQNRPERPGQLFSITTERT